MHSLGGPLFGITISIFASVTFRIEKESSAWRWLLIFTSPSAFLENQIHHELVDKPLSIIPFVLLQLLLFFLLYSLSTGRPAFIVACMKDRSLPGDKGACALLLLGHCHGLGWMVSGLRSINVV